MLGFTENTELFRCAGIDMIGNYANGCLIGLSELGRKLCDQFAHHLICAATFSDRDPVLFAALKEHGFLKDSMSVDLGKTAYLHVTQRCNLHCFGCYSRQQQLAEEPTLSSLEKVMDHLICSGVKTLHLSGGEPMLRHDIAEVVRYAKSVGFSHIDIATNGTVYSQHVAQAIAPLIDTMHISINSCDGNDGDSIKGGGLYGKVIDTINNMLGQGVRVTLLPTIHSQNIEDMPRYLLLAKQLGVPINFSILSCSACNQDLGKYRFDSRTLDRLTRQLLDLFDTVGSYPIIVAKKYCQAGRNLLSVTADGNIYPCHMLHSPEFRIGNALEADAYLPRAQYFQLLDFDATENDHCKDCEYSRLCGGGCRARAYASGGSVDALDPYCTLLKSVLSSAFSSICA